MDNITIYSPEDLSLKDGVLAKKINSAIWNLRFYDAGSFQFNLQENIFSINDIIRQGDKCGIVMKIVENFDQKIVYGYTLDAITKFRHIFAPKTFAGTAEEIICDVAELTLANSVERKIPKLRILRDQTANTNNYTVDFDNNNVFDKMQELCKLSEISYVIDFVGDNLVFKCVQGRNMVDFLKFGRRYRNVDSMEYTQDDYSSKNVVYSSYEETAEETGKTSTIYTSVGTATGFFRKETATTNRGEEQSIINNNKLSQSLKGIANDKLAYKKDWLLGDYVTASFEELIVEKQIVEVQEVYEKSNITIIPVFGEEKESPIRKLMQGGL